MMKKFFDVKRMGVTMSALLSTLVVSCNNERVIPVDEKPKTSEVIEVPSGPGIEIILDEGLRAGDAPIMGFAGDGKPIEIDTKKFYPSDYLLRNKGKIVFTLTAQQNYYVKTLKHRIFAAANPSVDLVRRSQDVEKVQLKEGRAVIYRGVLQIPPDFDFQKRYSLRLSLDGGLFEETGEKLENPLSLFNKVPMSIAADQNLRRWIRDVKNELKTWKTVKNAVPDEAVDPDPIKGLEMLEKDLGQRGIWYDDPDWYSEGIAIAFFNLIEGNAIMGNQAFYNYKLGEFRKKVNDKYLFYKQEFESYEGGGEPEEEHLMVLTDLFYNASGYGMTRAIYDVYVKDGSNKTDNLIFLFQARVQAIFHRRGMNLYDYVEVCKRIQDFRVNGYKKGTWGQDGKLYAPFRSGDPIYFNLPLDNVEYAPRTVWIELNKSINESKEAFFSFRDKVNALLPADSQVDFTRYPWKDSFLDRNYSYIKRRISKDYMYKTIEVEW